MPGIELNNIRSVVLNKKNKKLRPIKPTWGDVDAWYSTRYHSHGNGPLAYLNLPRNEELTEARRATGMILER